MPVGWMYGAKIADGGGAAVVAHANPRSAARGLRATSANCPAGRLSGELFEPEWRTL